MFVVRVTSTLYTGTEGSIIYYSVQSVLYAREQDYELKHQLYVV